LELLLVSRAIRRDIDARRNAIVLLEHSQTEGQTINRSLADHNIGPNPSTGQPPSTKPGGVASDR
jgi:hypothetical protein